MSCHEIVKDIIIPLLSAIIGGAVTMLGVVKTIKWEKNKNDKARIDAAKPWLFCLNADETRPGCCSRSIWLSSGFEEINKPIELFIKNAGTGIGVVTSLKTAQVEYTPIDSGVLEKETVTMVAFKPAVHKEKLEHMRLYVSDIYGNQYEYEVRQGKESNHYRWSVKEVSTDAELEGKKHVAE